MHTPPCAPLPKGGGAQLAPEPRKDPEGILPGFRGSGGSGALPGLNFVILRPAGLRSKVTNVMIL